jgi:hypothetical protein
MFHLAGALIRPTIYGPGQRHALPACASGSASLGWKDLSRGAYSCTKEHTICLSYLPAKSIK